MRRRRRRLMRAGVVFAIVASVAGAAAGDMTLTTPDGSTVRWSEWLAGNGPAAVLVWASWAPAAAGALDDLDGLTAAARARQLELVVVAVQESREEAAAVLGRTGKPWLHDRHGAILKEYRLIRVPTLVVIDSDGSVLARLEPSAAALRAWQR